MSRLPLTNSASAPVSVRVGMPRPAGVGGGQAFLYKPLYPGAPRTTYKPYVRGALADQAHQLARARPYWAVPLGVTVRLR